MYLSIFQEGTNLSNWLICHKALCILTAHAWQHIFFYETTLFILESMNLKHSKMSIYTKSTKRYAHKHIYTKRFVLVVKKCLTMFPSVCHASLKVFYRKRSIQQTSNEES